MSRFFAEPSAIQGATARIGGEDAKHILKVLRMQAGDTLTLCDGACHEYDARITAVENGEVLLALGAVQPCESELPYTVTLLQGIPKAGKMETIVQKCVELGVTEILPIAAQRSVVRTTPAEFEKKRARYAKVAAEAAKQARRGRLPAVGALHTFENVDYTAFDLILIPYEEERDVTLKQALRAARAPLHIAVAIGPEGGLELSEVETMRRAGGIAVTLGKRILRTETAGMAVLAMLQYELDGQKL